MSTIPEGELEAAVEARKELGKERERDVVEAFLDRVEQGIDKRIDERLENRRGPRSPIISRLRSSSERTCLSARRCGGRICTPGFRRPAWERRSRSVIGRGLMRSGCRAASPRNFSQYLCVRFFAGGAPAPHANGPTIAFLQSTRTSDWPWCRLASLVCPAAPVHRADWGRGRRCLRSECQSNSDSQNRRARRWRL